MMATNAPSSYSLQREKLAEYFDQTARQAWIELTGDSKVVEFEQLFDLGAKRCVTSC